MKTLHPLARAIALVLPAAFAASAAHAVTYDIDLSPNGGALNLGVNPYTQDHAEGLSPLNESTMFPITSSGNEIGAGITYDDVTNILAFDMAYGSAYGFFDLIGSLTVMHVHGPGPVNYPAPNTNAGVQFDLFPFHTPTGPQSGRITGAAVLTPFQEQMLIDNLLYVNIHSTFAPGGELRGQLILVPEPTSLALLGLAGLLTTRRRRA